MEETKEKNETETMENHTFGEKHTRIQQGYCLVLFSLFPIKTICKFFGVFFFFVVVFYYVFRNVYQLQMWEFIIF